MNKPVILIIVILFSLSAYARQSGADISHIKNKYLDIPYAALSDAQKLDIYFPDEGDGPFPVIISIHGGAWKWGDKRDTQLVPMLKGLKHGYAIVSVNYRLTSEAVWPAQIHDCKAAVRWIKANAEKYNLNPGKIAVWGGSAGGHLAALLGTTGGIEEMEDLSLGNSDQSSIVQAVITWYLPTNFLKMDEQLRENGFEDFSLHSVPDSPESELIGKNIADAPDLVKEANPETYVSSDDPPFLIQHGLEDETVPYQGSVILARKLGKVLGFRNVYLELFPATDHGGEAFGTKENLNRIFTFINKCLKNY